MPKPRVDVPILDVNRLGSYIREQRMNAEVSLRQLAAASGVSNPYLSQVERGLRNPSAEILGQIARALQISAETLYVQAGLLDERQEQPTVSVPDAIRADTSLTDRQRTVLLDIYSALQTENAVDDTAAEPADVTAPRRSNRSSASTR